VPVLEPLAHASAAAYGCHGHRRPAGLQSHFVARFDVGHVCLQLDVM